MNKKSLYVKRYEDKSIERFIFKFHKIKDNEVIKKLRKQDNMTDYVRRLIMADKIRGDNDKIHY